MSKLTPELESAFDELVKSKGDRFDEFEVYHCGSIVFESDFDARRGLWAYENVSKSRDYEGQAVNDYHKFRAAKMDVKPPFYLKLATKRAPYRYADFQGGSFEPILAAFKIGHLQGAYLLTEWARKKGYDLILGTNRGLDEIVVINPVSTLVIVDCQDLLTSQWVKGGPQGVIRHMASAPTSAASQTQSTPHSTQQAPIAAPANPSNPTPNEKKTKGLRGILEATIKAITPRKKDPSADQDDSPSP